MRKNIFKEIERSVMNEQMEETTRQKLLGNLLRMKEQKINLMITGATGVTIRKPVYYSAEYGYNIEKLLDFIIDNIILEKRQLIGA